MFCRKCGFEFEGNFCPKCGTKAEGDAAQQNYRYDPEDSTGNQQANYQQGYQTYNQTQQQNGSYQQPYGQYQQPYKQPQSGLGIAAFVLSFFIPIVGLILAIVDLCKKDTREKHTFAKAGLGVSIFFIVISLILILTVGLSWVAILESITDSATEDNIADEIEDYFEDNPDVYDDIITYGDDEDALDEDEVISDEPYEENGTLVYHLSVSEITASSEENDSFAAENIMDQSYETAWAEGVDGNGEGSTISFSISEGTTITQMSIAAGWWKDEDSFENYSAPTLITISTGEYTQSIRLEGVETWDEKEINTVTFDTPMVSDGTVTLRIDSARSGHENGTTCISEIAFYGYGQND